MKTLTKQLLLALALLSLCDQSNAQKRIQPDSGSEENESKRPRSEAAEAPSEADSSSQPMDTDSNEADDHTYDESLNEQLWDAISKDDTQLVKELLENGANPNADADNEDLSLLMSAVMSEHFEIVRILLDAGAEVNHPNEDGATPLIDAAMLPNRAIVHLLIQRSANIDAQDDEGTTALIYATRFNQPDNVQELITAGADVNQANNEGMTPLMEAAAKGNIEILQILLDAGADVTAVDNEGYLAIHWAQGKNEDAEDAIKAILEAEHQKLLDAVADEWQSCPLDLIQGPINEFLFDPNKFDSNK